MQTVHEIWKNSENIMFTSFVINARDDIVKAFRGTGYSINHKSNRYYDNGLLATTNVDGKPWLIIAWSMMTEAERESWKLAA